MARPRTWSDEQLAQALAGAPSWTEATRRLGLNPYGKTIARLRGHALRLNLDVSHLKSRVEAVPITSPQPGSPLEIEEQVLRQAIQESRTWPEVQAKLGLSPHHRPQKKTQEAAERFGIDTSGIFRQDWNGAPVQALPVPFSRPPAPENLSKAGAAMATAWFMERGYMVSVPLEPARYDLIAESDEGLKKVQVKTTRAYTVGIGRTVYGTGTTPSGGKYGRGAYAPGEIDLFFIYTWDRRSYLIPLEAVQGQMTLNLQKYESYRLSRLDERVQAPPPARQRKSRARRHPGTMPV